MNAARTGFPFSGGVCHPPCAGPRAAATELPQPQHRRGGPEPAGTVSTSVESTAWSIVPGNLPTPSRSPSRSITRRSVRVGDRRAQRHGEPLRVQHPDVPVVEPPRRRVHRRAQAEVVGRGGEHGGGRDDRGAPARASRPRRRPRAAARPGRPASSSAKARPSHLPYGAQRRSTRNASRISSRASRAARIREPRSSPVDPVRPMKASSWADLQPAGRQRVPPHVVGVPAQRRPVAGPARRPGRGTPRPGSGSPGAGSGSAASRPRPPRRPGRSRAARRRTRPRCPDPAGKICTRGPKSWSVDTSSSKPSTSEPVPSSAAACGTPASTGATSVR